jgi:hypothetical protein
LGFPTYAAYRLEDLMAKPGRRAASGAGLAACPRACRSRRPAGAGTKRAVISGWPLDWRYTPRSCGSRANFDDFAIKPYLSSTT